MKPHEFFAHWEEVQQGLYSFLEHLPETALSAGTVGLWNVHKQLLHIAEAEEGWLHIAKHNKEKWPEYSQEEFSDIAAVRTVLRSVHDKTRKTLESITPEILLERRKMGQFEPTVLWILWHVIEHTIHHKAMCFRIARENGLDIKERWGP